MSIKQEFIKTLETLDRSRHVWDVFSDFLRLASISIVNAVQVSASREEEYQKVASRYTTDQISDFSRLLALTVEGLEREGGDFLGEVYMGADMGSDHLGQFFTPFSLCRMMAEMNFNDFPQRPNRIYTISEPCVGGGAMILAAVEYFKRREIDFHNWVYVEAIDLSESAFRMAYIQLSLVGVSGHVVWGNTLTNERFDTWETPMYAMTLMGARMARLVRPDEDFNQANTTDFDGFDNKQPLSASEKPDTVSILHVKSEIGQLSLF